MITTITSDMRVDQLIDLSDKIYPTLDQVVDGEARARRIVRHGIQTVARALNTPDQYPHSAGDYYHALLLHELSNGGIRPSDYAPWPQYQTVIAHLPQPILLSLFDTRLDTLACAYADVRRTTISLSGEDETDASHAIHLGALALPYAAQYHPELDQSKIALYTLIHDIVEAYAGDTPSLGMSKAVAAQKQADEAAALQRITVELSPRFPRFVDLIHAYENLGDDEAKFVKTFDKLDPSFTHFANRGLALRTHHGLTSPDEFWQGIEQTTQRIAPYAGAFPDLDDRLTLIHRIAQVTAWSST